jgi:hypothetical protein
MACALFVLFFFLQAFCAHADDEFTVAQAQNNCWGDPPACEFRGRFDNWAACEQLCGSDESCRSFTWVGVSTGPYAHECRTRKDVVWALTPESNHVSGFKGELPPPVGVNCTTDEECSLLGVCTAGKCVCDPGWKGDDCGIFNLAPAVAGSGYNLTGLSPPTSSWGANIFQDDSDKKKWHMFVAEFANHCDISAWSPNSKITHSVSSTGEWAPSAAIDPDLYKY